MAFPEVDFLLKARGQLNRGTFSLVELGATTTTIEKKMDGILMYMRGVNDEMTDGNWEMRGFL